ncbi:MAG: hypothetical protein KGI38_12470 [Thaumarchaeota archaeon]|nr:hypothetical protein [Nitrososphaerota archaeon]
MSRFKDVFKEEVGYFIDEAADSGETVFVIKTNVYPVDARDVREAVIKDIARIGGDVVGKKAKGRVEVMARSFTNAPFEPASQSKEASERGAVRGD